MASPSSQHTPADDSPAHSDHSPKWSSYLFHPFTVVASVLILLTVLLRLPSLTEPYWYGDEGIYLTIGQALRGGAVLYRDIIDHKTPLIYFLTAWSGGTQLGLRMLLLGWMAATSVLLLGLLRKLTGSLRIAGIAAAGFVISTSLPALEGTIANGELFVIGFVTAAALLYFSNNYNLTTFTNKSAATENKWHFLYTLGAGFFLGLAILTKVPALFDALALFFIGWLVIADTFLRNRRHDFPAKALSSIKVWAFLAAGIFFALLLSMSYFAAQGALADYLQYGLLYNFHYAASWSPFTEQVVLQSLFSLPGKTAILFFLLVGLTASGTWLSRPVRWAAGWSVLALFAVILSNRPYPHYYLQLLLPLTVLAAVSAAALQKNSHQDRRFPTVLVTILMLVLSWSVWSLLGFTRYPTRAYYGRFFSYLTRQMPASTYAESFNWLIRDNYRAHQLMTRTKDDRLFIWGTNPTLYALTGMRPVGKLTVAFHITDLHAEAETMTALLSEPPLYIVVMDDEQADLPGFDSFLRKTYVPLRSLDHMTIWRRRRAEVL